MKRIFQPEKGPQAEMFFSFSQQKKKKFDMEM